MATRRLIRVQTFEAKLALENIVHESLALANNSSVVSVHGAHGPGHSSGNAISPRPKVHLLQGSVVDVAGTIAGQPSSFLLVYWRRSQQRSSLWSRNMISFSIDQTSNLRRKCFAQATTPFSWTASTPLANLSQRNEHVSCDRTYQ